MNRTALVLGANGLIGGFVVDFLLKNAAYQTVYALSRKGIVNENPKLIQIMTDADNVEEKIKDIAVNDFFSCIGTTQAKTRDKHEYYRIDHDYPIHVAHILKEKGCEQACLVSSIGANADSKNFYLKLKGETERSFIDVGFKSLHIFQPSLLIGKRTEQRYMEYIAQKLSPLLDMLLFGRLKNFQSIPAETVAKAMVDTALTGKLNVNIYKTKEIKDLV